MVEVLFQTFSTIIGHIIKIENYDKGKNFFKHVDYGKHFRDILH